jgi:hypothetical protein
MVIFSMDGIMTPSSAISTIVKIVYEAAWRVASSLWGNCLLLTEFSAFIHLSALYCKQQRHNNQHIQEGKMAAMAKHGNQRLAAGRRLSALFLFGLLASITITACLRPISPQSPDPATKSTTEGASDASANGERDMELIAAAQAGDTVKIQQLLSQGASVQAVDSRGRTALIAAAYANQVAAAELLIEAGADVNVKDDTQQSAYLIPTADGYLELLQLTLRSGADVHSKDSYNGTGLIRAADRGHIEIIQELLKTDIDVNHVNRLGWTALLEAIILGDGGPRHTEVVRLLVEAGADVNLADRQGVAPLMHAQQQGFTEIASILRAAGAR